MPSSFDENLDKSLFSRAAAYAQETAQQKAKEVASRWPQELELPDLVIGADTVVDLEGTILEKPMDAADAEAMLSRLSGHRHAVHTGVALILPSSQGVLTPWILFFRRICCRYPNVLILPQDPV